MIQPYLFLCYCLPFFFLNNILNNNLINNIGCLQKDKQGIAGFVYNVTTPTMPMKNRQNIIPQKKAIATTVYIYEATNITQVEPVNKSPFYNAVHTSFITSVRSDSAGYFFVSLPPGHYSLFIKKNVLFYANTFDNNNIITASKVIQGNVTTTEIKISSTDIQ